MEQETQYAIYWRSRITGEIGDGLGLFTREQAKQIADELNAHELEHGSGVLFRWAAPAEVQVPQAFIDALASC